MAGCQSHCDSVAIGRLTIRSGQLWPYMAGCQSDSDSVAIGRLTISIAGAVHGFLSKRQ